MFPSDPQAFIAQIVARIVVLLIAATFHETAHAWAALKLGDYTAYAQKRISLNPLDHIDPIGALMILLTGWGWFKPVPVNPYQLRRAPTARIGMAITAVAGPASNILLAVVAAIVWRLGVYRLSSFAGEIVWAFISINISLALFNMVPVPPLDGSKVLMGIVPLDWVGPLSALEPYGSYLFIFLILSSQFGFNLVGFLIGEPANLLLRLLTGLW